MKKILSSLLAFVLSAAILAPAAMAQTEAERVLSTLKERIGQTEQYCEFNTDTYEENGRTLYSFSWSEDENDGRMSVSCYDDGTVISYYKYTGDRYSGDKHISDVTADEAEKIARDFIDKINPDIKDELVIDTKNTQSYLDRGYCFSIKRVVDGIEVINQGGYIELNLENSEVTNFRMNMSEEIPANKLSKDFISKDAAVEAYKKSLPLELVYESDYEDEKITMIPVYVQNNGEKYINAKTGEVFEPSYDDRGQNAGGGGGEAVSDASVESADKLLSEAEIKNLEEVEGLIAKDEIEKKLRENTYFNLAEAELHGVRLNKYGYGEGYRYYFDFSTATVGVDAQNGRILNYFYRMGYDKEQKDETKDKELAAKIVKELAGDVFGEYKAKDEGETYNRYVNGARVERDNINIEVRNGALTYYSIYYIKDAEFPSLEKALSADEAADKMFEQLEYNVYLYAQGDKTEYVYSVDGTERVDPFTGEILAYDWETEKIDAYTDIDNHYAKDIINSLAQYGIGFTGGEFKPDDVITQGEFAMLLAKTFYGYEMPVSEIYERGIMDDIIKPSEQDGEKALSRETAAVYMIRALSAEEYANLQDIYKQPFADVEEYAGYIAILKGMGVVNGDENGNFNPKAEMTRAEAAVMLYNYLTR